MQPHFQRRFGQRATAIPPLALTPWRCEAVSLVDFERESLKLVEFLHHLADSFGTGNEEGERDEAEARRWLEFRQSVLPGDKLWLMTEPPSHPEVSHGSACLVITRDGNIVTRFQLYQPMAVAGE